MEKSRSGASKRRLATDKCLRCSLWVFSGIAISLMVVLLGFTIWTLVSYQNTVLALQSRVDKLELDLGLSESNREDIIATMVDEEVTKVMYMHTLLFRFPLRQFPRNKLH
jgi:hypothetical protein